MKIRKYRPRYLLFFAGLVLLAGLAIPALCTDRFCFSQDYRRIQGAEHIIFERNGWGRYYQRCFWGLKRIDFTPENPPVPSPDLRESDASERVLKQCIDTANQIRQSVYSPDHNYILYSEIEYGGEGIGDDEYCYYRVYEIDTGIITTIYQAYREWYNLSWPESKF